MNRTLPLILLASLASCIREDPPTTASPREAWVVNALAELEKNPIAQDEPGKTFVLHENADHTIKLMQVNGVIRSHYHAAHDETLYLLRGAGVFNMGGAEHEAKPGDLFVIPRGLVHGFKKTGEAPAAFLAIFTPRLADPDMLSPPLRRAAPEAVPPAPSE